MINAIFAVDEEGGLGKNGEMPWPPNKEDLKNFKKLTENQIVIMGRGTWESPDMPSPLPNRLNVVFTKNEIGVSGVISINGNVCDGILWVEEEYPEKEIFVIGGANILLQAKPIIQRIYMTQIPGHFDCDTKLDVTEFLVGFEWRSSKNLNGSILTEYKKYATVS